MNSEVLLVIQKLVWPIGVAIIGYFLIRLINTLDRVDKSVSQLDKTVTRQEAEQTLFRSNYEKDQERTENRLNAHSDLLDCHDREITTLKERSSHVKG